MPQSDRAVYFTKSAEERHLGFLARKAQAKKELLAQLEQLNHECVHPLNRNYWTAEQEDTALTSWARYMGLLSGRDEQTLRGW